MRFYLSLFLFLLLQLPCHAHEFEGFRWACSVSQITDSGVTVEVLNVLFLKEDFKSTTLYQSEKIVVEVHQYVNPLDQSNEYTLTAKNPVEDLEIARSFANSDFPIGLKLLNVRLGAYCRPI